MMNHCSFTGYTISRFNIFLQYLTIKDLISILTPILCSCDYSETNIKLVEPSGSHLSTLHNFIPLPYFFSVDALEMSFTIATLFITAHCKSNSPSKTAYIILGFKPEIRSTQAQTLRNSLKPMGFNRGTRGYLDPAVRLLMEELLEVHGLDPYSIYVTYRELL